MSRLFKPIKTTRSVTSTKNWRPVIGEMVSTAWGEAKVELIHGDELCCSNEYGIGVVKLSDISRVDEKRKSTVKKAVEILNKTFGIDTAHECICEKLYDAGLLKC